MSYQVFLPKTNFLMRGNLSQKEPEILNQWKNLYEDLRQDACGFKKFILNFGPPFANGHIHMGHALTEVLKDIVNKTYQMLGYDAPMVPGWDCHGLPIEWKIEEDYRKQGKNKDDVDVIQFRDECRRFAQKWIDIQKEEFRRLGIIADWKNPYITMDFEIEGKIVEQIGEFLLNGTLYRGLRPVLWSVVEKTALADNEVEYHDIISDSIYVAFPLKDHLNHYVVIWTTTPWTIPANRAIAYNKGVEYCSIQSEDGNYYIVAKDCLKSFKKAVYKDFLPHVKSVSMENLICYHPFREEGYGFEVPLLPGEHVTVDSGTGLVHIAPGHGIEDFELGKCFNIEIPKMIKDDGCYYEHIPVFAGQHVYKVNPMVMQLLEEKGCLLATSKIKHSYPHSWRSKKPLIYRVTDQWFIDIDKTGIRQKALEEIDNVNWFPKIGKNRIRSMVEGRPHWCISRQRVWGTPIAIFVDKQTGYPLLDPSVQANVVKVISEKGGDAWFVLRPEDFGVDSNKYEKVMDVVDVWFDSACVHEFVLAQRTELAWPADLYLEGSDQHRGWFQVSLLESVGTKGKAPYKNVLTHGFILDEKGYKMSKSAGNGMSPQEITQEYGADILRQWVVFCDYTEDIKIGPGLLKKQQELYRRFRNTLRYLLGALDGFDFNKKVEYSHMPELERYVLYELSVLDQKHKKCIKDYNYTRFYNELYLFCNNLLSSFYFDIRKDCLYCDSEESLTRRSYITVIDILFNAIVRFLAPVLSFTSEEAYSYYHNKNKSIHRHEFLKMDKKWEDKSLGEKWESIIKLRGLVTHALEKAREDKLIGSSLQAHIDLFTPDSCLNANLLNEICITSSFQIHAFDEFKVDIKNARGLKCHRCWKILPEVKDNLCLRCYSVINPPRTCENSSGS